MKKQEEKTKLNQVIIKESRRPNGTLRIQQDFSNCPTLAEQHTAHLTNINYLMETYKPDELAAYIGARAAYRKEILNHDFHSEPSMQDAMNVVLASRQQFDQLPDDVKMNFKNHVEFLKFIDNPKNSEKMIRLGLLTKAQLEKLQIPDATATKPTPPTTKEETKEAK